MNNTSSICAGYILDFLAPGVHKPHVINLFLKEIYYVYYVDCEKQLWEKFSSSHLMIDR